MNKRNWLVSFSIFLLILFMCPVFSIAADDKPAAMDEQETEVTVWVDSGDIDEADQDKDGESGDNNHPEAISLSAEIEEAIIGTYKNLVFLNYGIVPLLSACVIAYLFYKFFANTFS